MDWALIKMIRADKVEGNGPFSYEPTGLVQSVPFFFHPQLQVYAKMKLYKTGRSAGTTYAYYNGLMSVDISKHRTTNG
ncbi:uncharacterized protein N7518_010227 [Penicillium psychrosexuale]|uniref:uncharacterized protein n=1 Tax=Penicillium psychrosexuale TaxID=1002107 RepID=UPI002545978B|nr:uncharacterized protein N7518_010227 [Penicillium psychrosexuale]KAJ5781744.1 hypothetical protein N7518_010227 [Penicillium psychrosexuale]